MAKLPFYIPKSLASYVEQFDDNPIKATTRLKEQIRKRGADAVGYFLLAWFYHLKNMDKEAIDYALKAKIYAPGSPFFEKLHYYLAHPNTFEAWTPKRSSPTGGSKNTEAVYHPAPVLDLDTLIEKLSEIESEKMVLNSTGTGIEHSTLTEDVNNVDDIVSETLANIHETQGKTEAAIRTYKKLKKLNKGKKDFYKQQITRLKKLKNKKNPRKGTDEEE